MCEIKIIRPACGEKAPVETVISDTGANRINQVQNSMKSRFRQIEDLINLREMYKELYKTGGICGVTENCVHLTYTKFYELFSGYNIEVERHSDGYKQHSTRVNGVEFFCLVYEDEC